MSDTEAEFVTCLCNVCSGKVEFDRALFDPSAPAVVPCPHCGLETRLYIPKTSVRIRVFPPTPPTSPSPSVPAPSSSKNPIVAAPPIVQRPPSPQVSASQVFSEIFKWGILVWTALCAAGAGYGVFNVFVLQAESTSRSLDDSPTATTLGIVAGVSIWGIVWGVVAIPGAVLWLVTKPRQR